MVLQSLINARNTGLKQLALLIDPDKADHELIKEYCTSALYADIDYFFVGGSLITSDLLSDTIRMIKSLSSIPVVLFPGNSMHLDPQADALLLLSLISGRNAEFLIGQHVIAAPVIRRTKLEVLPVGYMLIDGGKPTTVSYISNSTPIPSDKPEIAASTAMAGELLGLKLIYLDAGSGAEKAIPTRMIRMTRNHIDLPMIVGGGIRTVEQATDAWKAGADVVVIGNASEKNPNLIQELLHKASRFRLS